MCKHILNAQVAIRTPCCKKWYDCPECHMERESHPLIKSSEIVLACKKCKKVFRKDVVELEEQDDSDEYCPHCDNHYVLEAKIPEPVLGIEGEDPRMNSKMLKDVRLRNIG
ncbi:hypothetical protein MP228_007946 [Amoeboaphelidium protococcarum]|nr:hypothetical protein MP228_007946 [Amoeboaphelidium protococcarum]